LWYSTTNWKILVLKSNRIKAINENIKVRIDIDKAIIFLIFKDDHIFLLSDIRKTPISGVNGKDNNNIYRKRNNYFSSMSIRQIFPKTYIVTINNLRQ
jgi:hypothetical protein